jgi:hypothetical protein
MCPKLMCWYWLVFLDMFRLINLNYETLYLKI